MISTFLFFYNFFSGSVAVIFSIYLLLTAFRNRAIPFFASFLLVVGYTIVYQAFRNFPEFSLPDFAYRTDDPLPFLFGPLFFLFVTSIATGKKFGLKAIFFHALPFLLFALYILVVEFFVPDKIYAQFFQIEKAITTLGKLISGLTYIVLSLRILHIYNMRIKQIFSSIYKIDLTWFSMIIYLQVVVWAIVIILYLITGTGLKIGHLIDPITYTIATIGVYAYLFFWFYQRKIFLENKVSPPEPVLEMIEEESEQRKYSKSGLGQNEIETGVTKLKQMITVEKPFLDNELTLKKLADKLSLSTHHLSQIINEKIGKNFYDFINELRVEEVKRELENPKKSHMTILSIAMDCGFNSKSTFNTCFKKYTGLTPSQYKSNKC